MESCFAFSISLFFFLNFLGVYSRSQSAPTYRSYHCNDTTLFAPNSIYQSNLDSLLSSLSSAANNTDGFANATAGQNPPDQIYGLFLCRGDLGSDMCNDCMATAKQNILELCPNQRVSIIWYEQCMLRYSNQSIFSVKEIEPSYIEYNDGSVSATRLPQFLAETLNDTIPRAPSDRSKKIIEAKQANYTRSQKFYTLAQCTPDLTMLDCHVCLEHAISDLVRGSQGGMVLTPSCTVRCEFYLFYDATVFLGPAPPPPMTGPEGTFMPPPPPPLPPPMTGPEGTFMPPPPLPPPMTGPEGNSNKSTMTAITIILTVGGVMVLFFLTCCLLRRKKTDEVIQGYSSANELTTIECLQFDLATIQAATNDFSPENKLGEGGFGEVFQGRLPDGQQIAVKRLSQSSRQGNEEFKNEVLLVAKLQHRNLVQLLGFCLEGDEKLLAYEFVPNKSLDYFLFDPQKSGQLNWLLRYKIIYGIARGMLYLHEDSRLRIIHRDLKCSNILLDSEMNPKISDFGMARIFGVDQTQASTNKIVGTFGYMSPEYAMHGEFSVKSDVYSFGILLIEIICGKKNNFYHQLDGGEYLTSYVWNQWRDGMPLKVLDPVIGDSYSRDEVLRCLHISLLCIQEDPTIRPTMATIVLMLNNNYFNPPSPRHPAFFIRSRSRRPSISMKELESDQSTNGMSITELYPR